MRRFARVALDTPVRREFSYSVPSDLQDVQPGCRVRIPFGPRRLVGIVVGLENSPPSGVPPNKIRPLASLLDAEPLLTPALLRLARHVADTTFCSWGQALAAMLPASLRRGRARRSVPVVEIAGAMGEEQLAELRSPFPKQERALAFLMQAKGPVEVREFRNRTGLSKSPLESLAKRGWVRFGQRTERSDPFADAPKLDFPPPTLTPRQQECVDQICEALEDGKNEDFLLFGITGSGKTEVYLRALKRCLEQGRGAIILVPEIALTPQTVARFRARCGEVAVLHSALTDAERHDQWLAIAEGRLRVVVGARSALFAPVPDLGLVVLDEEHENSFKQDSVPRYHARGVARERAHIEGAVCIFGSATPSLESWQAAKEGRLRLLELPERVGGGTLPRVRLVDMRNEKPEQGKWLVVSRPLQEALGEALEREEQAILFLNRRGYSPAWHCRQCGGSVSCARCDVALTFHRWREKALCHRCLAESPPPRSCPGCGDPVTMVGVGTERAEETLLRLFPGVRIARMDRDTMVRRQDYESVLGDFGRGEFDILLGTQMVAKGLDFPRVTVVGVLDADTALHQPDFRAAERCFGLVAQVSGRAGRGERPGQVVVQTWMPEHAALRAAVHHDYPGFAKGEMEERRDFLYPPHVKGVRILVEGADPARADKAARDVMEILAPAAKEGGGILLGPAPPPIEKLRGRWRRQVLLKAPAGASMAPMREALYTLCQRQGVIVDPL